MPGIEFSGLGIAWAAGSATLIKGRDQTVRLRRSMTTVAATTALVLGGMTANADSASAAGCKWGVVCGEVVNQTSAWMNYTTVLDDSSGGDWCSVWNSGGDAAENWTYVRCAKQWLQPHDHEGGWFSGTDVDAFTYPTRGYFVGFNSQYRWVDPGLWTKIHSDQTASCSDYEGVIVCIID
ncbi:hypothetical protein [Streptomyces asiaticus]|uniref:hypothetical protein n=2 Tax=Streptomyces asiaticus TaxID=114695 RepID=UPI003F663C04